jgi:hypothetical protein
MDVVVTGGNPQWFPFESPDQVQNLPRMKLQRRRRREFPLKRDSS